MNASTEITLWDAWTRYLNKTFESQYHSNGFFLTDLKYRGDEANESINFFLKQVGGLKMRDLESISRVNSLETKFDQLLSEVKDVKSQLVKNNATLDNVQKSQKETQANPTGGAAVRFAPPPATPPPAPTRQVNKQLENVRNAEDSRRSPKRKKPDDVKESDNVPALTAESTQQQPQLNFAHAVKTVPRDASWTRVVRRKPRQKALAGKKESTSLLGGTGVVDLVISGIRAPPDGNTKDSIDSVLSYITANGGADIDASDIELLTKDLKKRTWTFKITIKREQKGLLFDESFWPAYVYIRKFIPSQQRKSR